MGRTEGFDEGYAVVRVDTYLLTDKAIVDPSSAVYVKEIWWTLEEAEAEVARLNELADGRGGGSRYHCEYVRVRKRS